MDVALIPTSIARSTGGEGREPHLQGGVPPPPRALGPGDWLRVRHPEAGAIVAALLVCFPLLLLLRVPRTP